MPRRITDRVAELERVLGERVVRQHLREIAEEAGMTVEEVELLMLRNREEAEVLGITERERVLRRFAGLCDQTGTVADLPAGVVSRMETYWSGFALELEETIADATRR